MINLGLFTAGKIRLGAWLSVLPLCLIGADAGSRLIERNAYWESARNQRLYDQVPIFAGAIRNVELVSAAFAKRDGGERVKTEDELVFFMQQNAINCQLQMVSIKVLNKPETNKTWISSVSAELNAEGSFNSIKQFLNNVESVQQSISIKNFSVVPARTEDMGSYQLRMVLELSSMTDEEEGT